jgi:hypothetical protein
MIWGAIRYILIAASAATLIWFLYLLKTLGPPPSTWLDFAIPAGLVLNLAYLLFAGNSSRKPSRLMKLVALWLDAKEAELRRRARGTENSN